LNGGQTDAPEMAGKHQKMYFSFFKIALFVLPIINLVNVIDGKINYLEMIKGKDDPTYRKFKSRFSHLQWKEKQYSNQIQNAI